MGAPEAVINGKLFSCPDFPEAVQEDLAADSAHRQIRIATLIDVLGATSSYRSIEAWSPIQMNRVDTPRLPRQEDPHRTALGFPLADPFTGVLDDLLARRNRFFCKQPQPLDARTANKELKMGEFLVEMRTVMARGHINRAEQAGVTSQQLETPGLESRWSRNLELALLLVGWECNDLAERLSLLQRLGLPQLLGRILCCHCFSPSWWTGFPCWVSGRPIMYTHPRQ
jgi:hypothetical protein